LEIGYLLAAEHKDLRLQLEAMEDPAPAQELLLQQQLFLVRVDQVQLLLLLQNMEVVPVAGEAQLAEMEMMEDRQYMQAPVEEVVVVSNRII
jgi:hypothetical protein